MASSPLPVHSGARHLPPDRKQTLQAWLVLLMIGATAHAFLLVSDGLAYDSWLMYFHRQAGRFDLFLKFYTEHRIPYIAFLRWAMGYAPNFAVANHWLEFLSLFISSGLIYHIARVCQLTHRDGLLIAIFSLIYPAYQALPADEGLVYQWVLPVFFAGVYLAFIVPAYAGPRQWVMRILSWVCLLLSFNTGSLMVFYYGILALVVLRQIASRTPTRSVWHALQYLDYALLPFVFWVLNRAVLFSKPPIFNAEYNTPKLAYLLNPSAWLRFISNDVFGVLNWSLNLLPVGVLMLVMLATAKFTAPKADAPPLPSPAYLRWGMLFYGAFLLVCAMFPYVAVNKIAPLHGNDTRFALTVGYAMSLILTALLKWFLDANDLRARTMGWALGLALICAFVLANIDNNIAWLARWVKMNSVSANLAVMPAAKNVAIVEIDDQFMPMSTENVGWSLIENYFDWTGVLQLALGPRVVSSDQLVLVDLGDKMTTPEDRAFIRQYYLVDQFDPKGCRAKLTIQRAPAAAQMGQFGMARRYLYYRYLAPSGLAPFLRSLSTLNLGQCTF